MRRGIHGLNLLILALASLTALGQSTSEKPTKAEAGFHQRRFKQIREKYGSEPDSEPATQPGPIC